MAKNITIDMDDTVKIRTMTAIDAVDEDAETNDESTAVEPIDADVVNEDLDPADRLPSHAKLNHDGSVTLPLKFPRIVHSKKDGKIRERVFKELVMHRLAGADLRAIGAASDETMTPIAFARTTRLNQAVMNRLYDLMDGSDITACGQVLNYFLGNGRRTGR